MAVASVTFVPALPAVVVGGVGTAVVSPVLVQAADRNYTDAQVAALLALIDTLTPPTLDFSRSGMAGTAPYFARS